MSSCCKTLWFLGICMCLFREKEREREREIQIQQTMSLTWNGLFPQQENERKKRPRICKFLSTYLEPFRFYFLFTFFLLSIYFFSIPISIYLFLLFPFLTKLYIIHFLLYFLLKKKIIIEFLNVNVTDHLK